jgi:hypothetical protein
MAALGVVPGTAAGWFWAKGAVIERQADEILKSRSQVALSRCSGGDLATTLLYQASSAQVESDEAGEFLRSRKSNLESKISAPTGNSDDLEFNALNRDLDNMIAKLKLSGGDRESMLQEARSSCQLDDTVKKWGHLLPDWNDFLKEAVSPVSPEQAVALKQKAEKLESAGNPPDSSSWKNQSIQMLQKWQTEKLKPVETP